MSIPAPRLSEGDRTPPSKEECWEAFWEIWVDGLVDAYERGQISLPADPRPGPTSSGS